MISQAFSGSSRALRLVVVAMLVVVLAGCNMFGANKIKEEEIIPAATLYDQAISSLDRQRYNEAIASFEKLERQHPYSELNERAKLMIVFANYRIGKYAEAILAADRYTAIYPASKEMAYVLWLKGSSYYGQITDITRDQGISQNAIETYTMLIANYPDSDYAKDAREKLVITYDQLAGKEMSVGRYYLGNGQYAAAINRFRVVTEQFQTSTHVEEALYRLTEANLLLGLVNEAQTAAAVLGHNYPSSSWYKDAYDLLRKQGLSPQINEGSELAGLRRG